MTAKNKLNLNKLRFKWKVFMYLLGFCALLLTILWMIQTVFLDSFYKNTRVMEIKYLAGIIAENAASEEISEVVADISENNDISVDIVNASGRSTLTDFLPPDYQRVLAENVKLISLAEGNGGEFYEYSPPDLPGQPDAPRLDRFPIRFTAT